MFRLRTNSGQFAVKVLASSIAHIPNILAEFRRSEAIASELAAAGIPAVYALEGHEGTVTDLGSATILVHPWVAGIVLPLVSAGPLAGYRVGAILGQIHAVGIDPSRFGASILTPSEPTDWQNLVGQGREAGVAWIYEIDLLISALMEWEISGLAASRTLGERVVVGHRDLDQKNMIWSDAETPSVIDWESVSPVQPAVEVIAAALDWSGQSVGLPDRDTFISVLTGYRSVITLTGDECRLALRIPYWLGWLKACLNRSLDPERPLEDRSIGTREATNSLRIMRALTEHLDEWSDWCD